MFYFFRKKRMEKYIEKASDYVSEKYKAPFKPSGIRFSLSGSNSDYDSNSSTDKHGTSDDLIKFHLSDKPSPQDPYNASEVTRQLHNHSAAGNFDKMLQTLEHSVNQTFVDRLLYYINEKGVRDSEVYKAAQVDKRLFSKMVTNREYKPSKDTAIALALALELSTDEANDLLSRAGYTFSHSNKRDIIIEFFFREKLYNLIDANYILQRLDQKLIGRF